MEEKLKMEEKKLKVEFTSTFGCPACGGNFQSIGTPQECPLCDYDPNSQSSAVKGGFAIGGFDMT